MIVVTGAGGFIGSVLCRFLNQQGHRDLIVVDKEKDFFTYPNLHKVDFHAYAHLTEFRRDLKKIPQLKAIYHIGACSSTTEKNWKYLQDNNIAHSQELFREAARRKIPFIYASSGATYGNGEFGYSDSLETTKKLRPLNLYGKSKQQFDLWALRQKKRPPQWIGLKFFNVFGPNEYHKAEMRSLVCKAHEQILANGRVKLFKSHKEGFGDGEQLRDFVYVMDIVRAISELQAAGVSGLFNLGTGQARSFKDFVSAVFVAMGREINIEYIDMPLELQGQYQYFTQAEMDKFHRELPDFAFSSLSDAVSDYVVNYLQKEDPYF